MGYSDGPLIRPALATDLRFHTVKSKIGGERKSDGWSNACMRSLLSTYHLT